MLAGDGPPPLTDRGGLPFTEGTGHGTSARGQQGMAGIRARSPKGSRQSVSGRIAGTNEVISAAAARIAQEALKEDVSIEDLASLAHADAAFAMRLLALVNSPAFARTQTVSDINQAATLLGIRGLRTVALGLLVSTLCPPEESAKILMANALRRAVSCRLVAQAVGYRDLDGSFVVGLFLDSGLLCYPADKLEIAVAVAAGPAHHRVLREHAESITPHTLTGSRLAAKLGLPEDTVEAIRTHHDAHVPQHGLSRVAWIAERLAGIFESPEVDRARAEVIALGRPMGLTRRQIDDILEAVPAQVAEVAGALNSDVGDLHDLETLRNDAGRLLSDINQQYEGVIRKLGELLAEKERLAEQLRNANAALENMARTDALTGLCNRRALQDALERCSTKASAEGTWLGLVAVDVDHFKRLNDTYGHAAGDTVLARVGRLLIEHCQRGGLPARYGGEEFTVVLPEADACQAARFAEGIRADMEAMTIAHGDQALRVTASFGVAAERGPKARDFEVLLRRADEALYEAKHAGRNRVVASRETTGEDPQASAPPGPRASAPPPVA